MPYKASSLWGNWCVFKGFRETGVVGTWVGSGLGSHWSL
jgi:hypothetical protein